MKPQTKIVEGVFNRQEHLKNDIYNFYFLLPTDFHFSAGQYVQMTLPHVNADERGTSRFFTVASSPTEAYVMITSRKGKSSFKKTLFGMEPGANVQFFGPIGTFVLPV